MNRRNLRAPLTLVFAMLVAAGGIVAWSIWTDVPRQSSVPATPPAGTEASLRGPATSPASREYAGSESCRECHAVHADLWADSHHGLAQRPVDPALDREAFEPTRHVRHGTLESTARVRDGRLEVVTLGVGNEVRAYEPRWVLGVAPLRQFVIPFERGRYQVTELAYDPVRKDWFDVYGDEDRRPHEWGFWTGRGMNWNSMCATCHTTRLRKGYDPADDSYETTWKELGVGCESCHGSYADHAQWHREHPEGGEWPGRRRPAPERVLATCGSCHARRVELTAGFVPGDAFADHYRPVLPDHGETYYADGQVLEENFEYGSFILSRMHGEGVTCIHCHDPHTAKLRVEKSRLCLTCHGGKISPVAHGHHAPGTPGSECVDCHMPLTTYMERHPRRDHGFTIPDPLLTIRYGIPNACNRCHTDRTARWALETTEKWYGKRMERNTRRRAITVARARAGDEAVVDDLITMADSERAAGWRSVAIGLLGRWIDRYAVRARCLEWLRDDEPLVRAAAARALEPLHDVDGALAPLLDDPVRLVRIEAAWALRRRLDLQSNTGRELLQAMEQTRDQPGGALQLGNFHLDRGDPTRAVTLIERAISWDTQSPQLRAALAVALQEAGRPDAAVRTLEEACELDPETVDWRYSLGLALAEAGDLEGAAAHLEKACALDPTFARSWYNLGLALVRLGRTDDAITALQRAEEESPDVPDYPYARATVHWQRGERDAAREAARQALHLAPDYLPARQFLEVDRP